MTIAELRQSALDAHRAGVRFEQWWPDVVEDVRQAAPYDRQQFTRLQAELLSIVIAGDTDGVYSPGDDDALPPWEADDEPDVDDNTTAAKAPPELLTQTNMFSTAEAYR